MEPDKIITAVKNALEGIQGAVWGPLTVLIIAAAGAVVSLGTGFIQLRGLKQMLLLLKRRLKSGGLRQTMTALGATVGSGSVSGVAAALAIGGPGALFWLWVSGLFGMGAAYGEGVLSIRYRDGKKGGIMYSLRDGLGERWAAWLYAVFTLFASLGMGCMAQTGAFSEAAGYFIPLPGWAVGIVPAALAVFCLFSKGDFSGAASERVMPAVSLIYLALCLLVIALGMERLPYSLSQVFKNAVGIRQAAGGAVGWEIARAASNGFRRGIFSSEAGLGSTAAIHASDGLVTPHEQGLLNIFEVIVDTFIICTVTALSILCSGVTLDSGLAPTLTVTSAFERGMGGGALGAAAGAVCALCVMGFCLGTIIGWSKIGLGAAEYLFSSRKAVGCYRAVYPAAALLGCILRLDAALAISDIFNGLMAYPCSAAIILLRREIFAASAGARASRSSRSRFFLSRFRGGSRTLKPREGIPAGRPAAKISPPETGCRAGSRDL